MTLLERVSAPDDQHKLEHDLADALLDLPGVRGLVVTRPPEGTRGLLVVDKEGESFFDVEEDAMERLVAVRRSYPHISIDVICVPTSDAERMQIQADARVYRRE